MCDDQETIYKGKFVTVGMFHQRPHSSRFRAVQPMQHNVIVFPRTSVSITFAGEDAVVTDPNLVMFYNSGQEYARQKLSERGDLCEWFLFDDQVLEDALGVYYPAVKGTAEKPFPWNHGPSDPSSFLLQRLVVEHILEAPQPDALFIEENLLFVLGRVVENAYKAYHGYEGNRKVGGAIHVEITNLVKTMLATRFRERLTLDQIAREVNYSPYYLCRVFRNQTGCTIHQYLDQIRLRTSLEFVSQEDTDLTSLALTLGYSSHSHFTHSFRRTFGAPPSELRQKANPHHLHKLRKILIA
ncbi:MAG: helix-turn-helix transcriptional regulator [Anaerolineales bacterium]|jgi:AraC family transcriptional regulator